MEQEKSLNFADYAVKKADKVALSEGAWIEPSEAYLIRDFARRNCKLFDEERRGHSADFLPWAWNDLIWPVYSFKDAEGRRLKTRVSCWMMRKQAKSTTLSIIALWEALKPGAEVYIMSSSLENANAMFKYCDQMVRMDPELNEMFWVRKQIRTIETRDGNGFIKVLSGLDDSCSGQNASCVLIDEIADFKKDKGYYRLFDSSDARANPIWIEISTPQYEKNSLGYSQYQAAYDYLHDKSEDPSFLGIIYGVPDFDENGEPVDWQNSDNWWAHIPRCDKSRVLRKYRSALEKGSRHICQFRNHALGQWTESAEQWLWPHRIDEAMDKTIREEDFSKKKCFIGIDSAVSELGSYQIRFPDEGVVIPRFYIPKESAQESDRKFNTKYQAWISQGYIREMPGNLFDPAFMLEDIKKELKNFRVLEIGYDPAGIEAEMVKFQQGCYCPCVPVRPYASYTSGPTMYLERLIHAKKMRIQFNPCMAWNLRNAAVKPAAGKTIIIDKKKSGGRYDGVSALIMALHRELAATNNPAGIITI